MGTTPQAYAYIDEAGELGYAARLLPEHDHLFGLLLAVVIRDVPAFTSAFQPAFDDFRRTTPPGATLHITDAVASPDPAWRAAGLHARAEALRLLRDSATTVVYNARRCRLEREALQRIRSLIGAGEAMPRRSSIQPHVPTEDPRVEQGAFQDLLLKLDGYASDRGVTPIAARLDETSKGLRTILQKGLAETKSLDEKTIRVSGYDPSDGSLHRGEIRLSATGADLNTSHIGSVEFRGKLDPLVLVADIATNDLYRHLGRLASDAPLNAPSSIAGWALEALVYGTRDDASEDLI